MNITIVGGGFGGVKAALELAAHKKNKITLITNKPDFQYYPALYGAATGNSHLQSWVPLDTIFAGKKNVNIVIDTVTTIDPEVKQLSTQSGMTYAYDTCVMALGTVTTYFGIEGLDRHTYGIKSASEVMRLQDHIATDLAENRDVDKRYVIVGAGPTGVELAAAMGSYLRRLCKEMGIKNPRIHIDLVEAAPRVLPRSGERASKIVERRLRRLGVNVRTGMKVESASDSVLMVSGEALVSHTVIWTSGVANHPFYKENEQHFTFAPNGRVEVNEFLQVNENLYVIGDNAATKHTGLAQTALHDGQFVARNLIRASEGRAMKPYRSVHPVSVIPVGSRWALLEWKGILFGGWMGAIMRRAADFIGYSDVLPIGQTLGVWRAGRQKNALPEDLMYK